MWSKCIPETAALQEILFFQVLFIKSQLCLLSISNSYSCCQHDIIYSGLKAMHDESSDAFAQ